MASKKDNRCVFGTVLFALMVLLLATASSVSAETADEIKAGVADSSSVDKDSEAQDSGAAAGVGGQGKLQIHGHMTQAYAEGKFMTGNFVDRPTEDENALGIPEGGTTDYRFMALQFRYEISPKDIMTVQLSSRSNGGSVLDEVLDDIELDWAFYERRLGDNTTIKVGRVPIALGIYNEIRDVGTILPFYRPSYLFYRNGFATTETVDGINMRHVFFADRDWNLETTLYGGGWRSFESNRGQLFAAPRRDSWGAWVWLSTPIPGVRVGAGLQRQHVHEGAVGALRQEGEVTSLHDTFASFEAAFTRFEFRAEWRRLLSQPGSFPTPGENDFVADIPIFYAQAGVSLTRKFRIYVQAEFSEFELRSPSRFTENVNYDQRTDYGISLNYAFTPSLVVKAEYHDVKGENWAPVPVMLPEGLRFQPIYTSLDGGSYSIISLSVSF